MTLLTPSMAVFASAASTCRWHAVAVPGRPGAGGGLGRPGDPAVRPADRPLPAPLSPPPARPPARSGARQLGSRVGVGLGRLPAPIASAVLCRLGAWRSVRRPLHPRAQVGRRPVAVHGVREGGTASTRRPAGLPARREPLYCRVDRHAGASSPTGGREPVASACTVLAIGDLRHVVRPKGGSRRAGRPADRRFGRVAIFPLDVNRNRAPAHLRSGVEWPAHGTQSSRRPSTALPDGAGRRRASLPKSSAAMGAEGARASPVRTRPAVSTSVPPRAPVRSSRRGRWSSWSRTPRW